MKNKPFEIFIEEVGDRSVGLISEQTFKAEISQNFLQQLKDDGTLKEFERRLVALVSEFYEPDTYFDTYDTDYIEAEREHDEWLVDKEGI